MALTLALLIWLIALITAFGFAGGFAALPALISQYRELDAQFQRTLIVTGTALLLSHALLGYLVYRYRARAGALPHFTRGNARVEIAAAVMVALIFLALAFSGQRAWRELQANDNANPADLLVVEVLARQFVWHFHYSGADRRWGQLNTSITDDRRVEINLDRQDTASRDDLLLPGRLVVPINRPVKLMLRSQDVIHSLFIPTLRIKQDAVPGLTTTFSFTAVQTGTYEIACAELCGRDHYKMRAQLEVVSAQDFARWLATGGAPR
jgi:cytochrome c oxidase subunit II